MSTGEKVTIGEHLQRSGVSRRSFLELCSKIVVAAPIGLALTHKATAAQVAKIVGKARRPSVIWLHFQDCTGCTETLLRTSAPDVAHLILDVISLDYHETLMAASGAQAEAALKSAIEENAGKYVLVVEGAIPTRDDGVYMERLVQSSRCHCDWLVCIVGRSSVGGSESNGGGRSRLGHFRKAHRQSSGMPSEPVQPACRCARVRHDGTAAGDGQPEPAEICV